MTSLLSLPNELLLLIAKYSSVSSLYSLIQTNQRFSTLLTLYLHHRAAKSRLCVTAICWAVATRNEPLLRVLLENGSSITIEGNEWELLHQVPGKCDDATIKRVLEKGVNIIVRKKRGRRKTVEGPALHWAVIRGDEALAVLLLENGAEVNAVNSNGETALHIAVAMCHEGMVSLLLGKGADRFTKDIRAGVPLDNAICPRTPYPSKVVMLLLADTDVNFLYRNGLKPIHLVALYSNDDAAEFDSLLAKGASFTDRCNTGETALHFAAERGNEKIVRLLVDKGADIHDIGQGFTSPVLRFLRLCSPITLACSRFEASNLATQRFLLKRALPNSRANIVPPGSYNIVVSALHQAAAYHDESLVQSLLERGFDVNSRDLYGITPLHAAVSQNPCCETAVAIAELLLEHGANINARDIGGCTPLHSAVIMSRHQDREAVVKLLVDKGSNVNCLDRRDVTPLHNAMHFGDERMVQLLLNRGADATIQDPISCQYRVRPIPYPLLRTQGYFECDVGLKAMEYMDTLGNNQRIL